MIKLAKKIVACVAVCVIVAVSLLMGAIWFDHTRETTLPMPTGAFAVGRTSYVWSDASHIDSTAPEPGTKRELIAWIWYPASAQRLGRALVDYLPPDWRAADERHRGPLVNLFTRDLSRVHAHSLLEPGLSPQQRTYPIVFLRGGHSAQVTRYTALAEDLASDGYVVVGIDAPYRTSLVVFADGRKIGIAPQNNVELVTEEAKPSDARTVALATKLVGAWSADLSFALDQLERLNESDPSGRFKGRLDTAHVGVFGHSLGGTTSLQFCRDDIRCKAAIDVDGDLGGSVLPDGVARPLLFLLSDHSSEAEEDTRPVLAGIRAIYDRRPPDQRLWIMIRGANHFMFSEDGALLRSPLVTRLLRTVGIIRIDGRRQIAVTAHFISAFFDVYLKGAPAAQLQAGPNYPEIEYLR